MFRTWRKLNLGCRFRMASCLSQPACSCIIIEAILHRTKKAGDAMSSALHCALTLDILNHRHGPLVTSALLLCRSQHPDTCRLSVFSGPLWRRCFQAQSSLKHKVLQCLSDLRIWLHAGVTPASNEPWLPLAQCQDKAPHIRSTWHDFQTLQLCDTVENPSALNSRASSTCGFSATSTPRPCQDLHDDNSTLLEEI